MVYSRVLPGSGTGGTSVSCKEKIDRKNQPPKFKTVNKISKFILFIYSNDQIEVERERSTGIIEFD